MYQKHETDPEPKTEQKPEPETQIKTLTLVAHRTLPQINFVSKFLTFSLPHFEFYLQF